MSINNASLFRKLLWNHLLIVETIILLFMGAVYMMFSFGVKNDIEKEYRKLVSQYAEDIRVSQMVAVEKSDFIVNNIEILTVLKMETDDIRTQLESCQHIDNYLNVVNNADVDVLKIYSGNEHLFQGRFVRRIDSLDESETILSRLTEKDVSLYWDDALSADDYGRFFTLYRRIDIEWNTIIQIKAYLPKPSDTTFENSIEVKARDAQSAGNVISENIGEHYSIVCRIPESAFAEKTNMLITSFCFITAFLCLVVAVIMVYSHRRLTFGIVKLIHGLSDKKFVKDAQLQGLVPSGSYKYKEMKILADALAHLSNRVQEACHKQYQTELEKQRIAYNLLQSKINPHVLYNSLSVVSSHAFDNNDRKTLEIINKLVAYYRLLLSKGRDFVSVADEIALVEKYIEIGEISNGHKIEFTAQIEDGLEACLILHLLIQPFVENAVVHGLAGAGTCRKINIKGYFEEEFLVFEISDNGVGINKSKLDDLNKGIYTGYGITNTFERMKLNYGDACSLEFQSCECEYTTVVIKVSRLKMGEGIESGGNE